MDRKGSSRSSRRSAGAKGSGDLLTSVELLRRAQGGENEAMGKLIERYLPLFKRWARRRMPGRLRGAMDTDDLVQETLLHAIGCLARFEPQGDGALQAYFYTAVCNRARDIVRRAQRRGVDVSLDSGEPDKRPDPLEVTIEHEAYERYLEALSRLEPQDREAIVARIELGQSWAQVAEVLGKSSPDAARMMVNRALTRLARWMARDGVDR